MVYEGGTGMFYSGGFSNVRNKSMGHDQVKIFGSWGVSFILNEVKVKISGNDDVI